MAPAISSQEIIYIPRGPRSAQSILSTPLFPVARHPHCSTFRRRSLSHKRRFRYRQFSDKSIAVVSAPAVDGTPLPSSPMADQHSVILPSTDVPAATTVVSDSTLSGPALPQPHAARYRVTGITAALIAVCVIVGLAACTILARLAYRRRSSLLRRFRRHRQAEDNLGFVFIEYDNSAWGPPAKYMRKDMPSPSSESGVRSPGGEEVHIELVSPGPSTPAVLRLAQNDSDPCSRTYRSATHGKTKILNALGLAMESGESVKQSTLASPQLAAVLALHPGEVDGVVETPGFTPTDSLASDSVGYRLSSESSGSEEDSELQKVETLNRDITVSLGPWTDIDCVEDTKSPQDVYDLPRVVISSSSSVASEALSSCSNRASGMSLTTIDLGDFPRPPFLEDKLTSSTSTSLISEIEVSLGPIINRGLGLLGLAGRRASSAPQLTV
ncbi:hypothetical protein BGY98DRAFT_978446 [Russula aff. rugulosa BPL654]|nr:hypothetical protein BGY98DRAFT_978446 [Russula aff. rugulosa BPL654]